MNKKQAIHWDIRNHNEPCEVCGEKSTGTLIATGLFSKRVCALCPEHRQQWVYGVLDL